MAGAIFTKGSGRAALAGAGIVLVVVAAAAGGGYALGWRVTRPAPVASCIADEAIDSGTRAEIDRAGLNFVNTVAGINPVSAYSMLSAQTKGTISPDRFLATLRPSLEPVEPFGEVIVAHAYFVRAPVGGSVQPVICGTLDRPDHWVAVTARPVPEQAHLIIEAEAKGGRWAFVLWLVREGDWHVQGFNFVAIGMGGKNAQEILAMARAEHEAHHDFNAVLLYGAATRLLARGNDLKLGMAPEVEAEAGKLTVPPYLQGKPPLGWKFGDHVYQIANVGAAGAGDKLYLAITQQISPWTDDKDADASNRNLINDLATALPEYARVFAGLVVVARDESGTHLYRTVATPQAAAK